MCHALGLEPAYAQTLREAAVLHDIGKLTIARAVWDKPAHLDPQERALVEHHTTRGHGVLRRLGPRLADLVSDAALSHHEAWDGSGYPNRSRGEAIPFAGRLIALCDTYAALREARPYKPGFTHAHATQLMLARGPARVRHELFDPALLSAFMAATDAVQAAFHTANAGEPAHGLAGLRRALKSAAAGDTAPAALAFEASRS
jgi:putative two-component system response regulator